MTNTGEFELVAGTPRSDASHRGVAHTSRTAAAVRTREESSARIRMSSVRTRACARAAAYAPRVPTVSDAR